MRLRRSLVPALVAALVLGSGSAVLAQPGPPDDRPGNAPEERPAPQGSPTTGQQAQQHHSGERPDPPGAHESGQQQRSDQGREHGQDDPPVSPQHPPAPHQPAPQQRPDDAPPAVVDQGAGHVRPDNAPEGHDDPGRGMEQSEEGRERASDASGLDVPVDDEARDNGRAFGQERATSVREHVDVEDRDDDNDARDRDEIGPPETATAAVADSPRAGFVQQIFERIRGFLSGLLGGDSAA
jgi:hypothetical protein